MIILLSEIVLLVVLYILLKPVSKTLSLVTAVSRLAMTTIHGLNLLNYYFVLQLLKSDDYLSDFGQEQVNALASLFFDAHSCDFTIGVAFLVPHVLILGYLILPIRLLPQNAGHPVFDRRGWLLD